MEFSMHFKPIFPPRMTFSEVLHRTVKAGLAVSVLSSDKSELIILIHVFGHF